MSYHKHFTDYQVEHNDNEIYHNINIRKLISSEDSINFQMVLLEILPTGYFSTTKVQFEQDFFVFKGNLTMMINNENKILNSGDFIYIPRDAIVEIKNNSLDSALLIQVSQTSKNLHRNSEFPEFYHKNQEKIEKKEVTNFGSKGTTIQIFNIPQENFPFIMRRFELNPGGNIGVHNHSWEHEMFLIHGQMKLINNEENYTQTVNTGEFIFMSPDEMHGYINDFEQPAIFICMIPNISWNLEN